MSVLISVDNVTKYYGTRKNPIKAVGPVSLNINQGSFTVILGRSGSGKSTLLNLLCGLDKVTSGELVVGSDKLNESNSKKLAKYRSKIGIIFQFYNLLPNLNTVENVMMGSWAGGKSTSYQKAVDLLTKFNLGHRFKADVKTLSGGEKQRVAICRALIGDPEILFCDEPTGALDTSSETQVKDILAELNKSGLTIVMVTHNPEFAGIADNIINMSDGEIIDKQ
ncbi:MAG: ABC transporter ATP-binding protein [Patescibacteria group bacterium]